MRVSPTAQRLECGIESRPRVQPPGGAVLVEQARGNAGGPQASRCRSVLCDPSAFDTRI